MNRGFNILLGRDKTNHILRSNTICRFEPVLTADVNFFREITDYDVKFLRELNIFGNTYTIQILVKDHFVRFHSKQYQ